MIPFVVVMIIRIFYIFAILLLSNATTQAATSEDTSKIVGFAVLNSAHEKDSKVVGFAVLGGSLGNGSKIVGFAVLDGTPTPPGTGITSGQCTALEHGSIDITHVNDSSITLTGFSTSGVRKILAIPINGRGNSYVSVNNIVGGGLIWNRRGSPYQMTNVASECFAMGAPCFIDVEVWEADAVSPLASQTITADWNGPVLAGAMAVIAFGGFEDGFDTNLSLPAHNDNPSGPASLPFVSGISTDSPSTLLIGICEWNKVPGFYCSFPNGFKPVGGSDNYQLFNGRFMGVNVFQKHVKTFQSSTTITTNQNPTTSWSMIVDALKCPANVGRPTIWISVGD